MSERKRVSWGVDEVIRVEVTCFSAARDDVIDESEGGEEARKERRKAKHRALVAARKQESGLVQSWI
jgi:hypothetical protein